jgi:hypothetical protein
LTRGSKVKDGESRFSRKVTISTLRRALIVSDATTGIGATIKAD